MESPLLKFTNDTLAKIKARTSTLRDMNLDDLLDYLTGLGIHKPQLALHIRRVEKEIEHKWSIEKKAPKTAEKSK